jgi:hypothetical protein
MRRGNTWIGWASVVGVSLAFLFSQSSTSRDAFLDGMNWRRIEDEPLSPEIQAQRTYFIPGTAGSNFRRLRASIPNPLVSSQREGWDLIIPRKVGGRVTIMPPPAQTIEIRSDVAGTKVTVKDFRRPSAFDSAWTWLSRVIHA